MSKLPRATCTHTFAWLNCNQVIAELIYEEVHWDCDYYIVDKKYNWLITCNHHDIIQFVGKGLEIKKIEDMIMQRKG